MEISHVRVFGKEIIEETIEPKWRAVRQGKVSGLNDEDNNKQLNPR